MLPADPLPLHGYVLAGGKSSRMGTDKATLPFQGAPLIQRAVEKLRQTCCQVTILGNRLDLGLYTETLPDRIPEAGPLAAIDNALHHTSQDWLLLLPVDVPFLPISLLTAWACQNLADSKPPLARFFEVDGRVQPLIALLHRSLAPSVRSALDRGERKVLPVLEAAAHSRVSIDLPDDPIWTPTLIEQATRNLWFANANTPEELARIDGSWVEANKILAGDPEKK